MAKQKRHIGQNMEGEMPSFRVERPPPSTLMHLPTWKVSEPRRLGILWKFCYMGWLIKSLAIHGQAQSPPGRRRIPTFQSQDWFLWQSAPILSHSGAHQDSVH